MDKPLKYKKSLRPKRQKSGNFSCVAFNKPCGILSQFTPEDGHGSLRDFQFPPGLYPAGRLDCDSEGLLILTDDGNLANKLINPKFGHKKTYIAQVEKIPGAADLLKLREGVVLSDGPSRFLRAELVTEPPLPPRFPPVRFRKTVPTSWVLIAINEGRNRQVRRTFAAIGYPVLRLVRTAIGNFRLGQLPRGRWQKMCGREIKALLADSDENRPD